MRLPGIVHAEAICGQNATVQTNIPGHGWGPSRPLPFYSWTRRWRAAWLVFTGRADALVWPGQ